MIYFERNSIRIYQIEYDLESNQQSGRALLDAISAYGVENVSALVKRAGLSVETTRYQVWHELPSRGLTYDVELNFELMGPERWKLNANIPKHVDPELSSVYSKRKRAPVMVRKFFQLVEYLLSH